MGNMLKKTKKLQGTITEHLLKGLHADTLDLKISVKIPHLKVHESGTSLIIQCLRICTSITGNMGSIFKVHYVFLDGDADVRNVC